MLKGRAIWIGSCTVGELMVFASVFLTIYSLVNDYMVLYRVRIYLKPTSYIYADRERNLMEECALPGVPNFSGQCFPLVPDGTFNDAVQPILSGRKMIPILQIISLALTTIAWIIIAVMLILLSFLPQKFQMRAPQYVTLSGAAVVWIASTIYFYSIVMYFHVLSIENYLHDPKLISARSSWDETLRSRTTETEGNGVYLAVFSLVMNYLGCLLLLISAMQIKPPILESVI